MAESKSHANSMCTLFEQSLTLIAQTYNEVTYQRRVAVISSLLQDSKRAKSMLKENPVDKDSDQLFGDKFEQFVNKNVT